MKTPPELLAQPAARGARWLALRFLQEAHEAHPRLANPADAEALHDFRVALRRLRSLLRALREPLGDAVRSKDRHRIRDLAHATSHSRDAEVQITWTEGVLPELDEAERPGAAHLLSVLRERLDEADVRLRAHVEERFPRARRRLARRLAVYRSTITLDAVADGPTLARVVAERVGAAAAELRDRVDAIGGIDDANRAHRTRIAAKRLRYLLEPFARTATGADEAVAELKQLQDALGEMHDAEVMRDTLLAVEADLDSDGEGGDGDPRPGLRALAHRLFDRRAAAWARVEPAWLGGAAAEFFARVEAVRRELAGRDRVEIERKFLLRCFPRLPDGAGEQRIDQGWLPGERLQERIRRVRDAEGERYFRTVKVGTGITRLELEEETTRDVFRRLWPLTRGKRVTKRRYTVPDGDLVWEVDRFTDRRLVLAEVELPSEDTPAPPPAWLADAVEREVTGEREYVNLYLAR